MWVDFTLPASMSRTSTQSQILKGCFVLRKVTLSYRSKAVMDVSSTSQFDFVPTFVRLYGSTISIHYSDPTRRELLLEPSIMKRTEWMFGIRKYTASFPNFRQNPPQIPKRDVLARFDLSAKVHCEI